jgi:hypothetical protein
MEWRVSLPLISMLSVLLSGGHPNLRFFRESMGLGDSTLLVLAIIIVLIGGGLVLYFLTISTGGTTTSVYP